MPPANSLANSPNRPEVDSSLLQQNPTITPTTRLPIIRTSAEENTETGWRALLARAIDQVSEPSQDWPLAEANSRPGTRDWSLGTEVDVLAIRRQARAHAFENPPSMSTYLGWAPGSSEHERSAPNPSRSANTRHDHSLRTHVTRRYQREMETARHRTANVHSIPEHMARRQQATEPMSIGSARATPARSQNLVSSQTMEWEPTSLSSRRRDQDSRMNSISLQPSAWLESVRRQTALESERRNQGLTETDRQFLMMQEEQMRNRAARGNNRPIQTFSTASAPAPEASEAELKEMNALDTLESVIPLLDDLRWCSNKHDRVNLLKAAGITDMKHLDMSVIDRSLDTSLVTPPQPTSFLVPGTVFQGKQRSLGTSQRLHHWQSSTRRRIERMTQALTQANEAGRPWRSQIADITAEQANDHWPVKVTISSINYDKMTMTGTMEAFNVPHTKSASTAGDSKVSSITTYLEGEIIDMRKHSLLTTKYKAGPEIDSIYWRKLEPFKDLSLHELTEGLTDMEWLSENIAQHWVIMRWKEKCFLTPSDEASGLTISGFYYITMRRSDGSIQGLYHDPDHKVPAHQHLDLMPGKPMFPKYAFR